MVGVQAGLADGQHRLGTHLTHLRSSPTTAQRVHSPTVEAAEAPRTARGWRRKGGLACASGESVPPSWWWPSRH
jgi:hypothetical protein